MLVAQRQVTEGYGVYEKGVGHQARVLLTLA